MSRSHIWKCLLPLLILLMTAGQSDGRPRRVWTYKLLWSESEVVCIGAVKSTKVVANTELLPDYLEGLESEVVIVAVLKGETQSDTIRFRHFRYRQDIKSTLGNGPSFAVLRDQRDIAKNQDRGGPVELGENKKTDVSFLFFLKRRGDEAFGPASGDEDASISVAQVLGNTDDKVLHPQK